MFSSLQYDQLVPREGLWLWKGVDQNGRPYLPSATREGCTFTLRA